MFVFRYMLFSVTCLRLLDPVVSPEENWKPGQDVPLKCQDRRNVTITLIKWQKQGHGYVFYYRDELIYENYADESFRGRVHLNDPTMKNGNVSVILKNVTINDTGRYECLTGTSSMDSDVQLIHILNLTVTDPGHREGGHVGLTLGLPVVAAVLLLAAI
ncbi:V-set domain-containing T-cell activation inhibitor 1-like [Mastacembelus armatus]|uniref:V-set domain-containing T-cell activation inhibitor 1-like n=1 Tax=Mastacembelus armatus TaxID=205130 RepID=UPI000E459F34|nr:V-set domain-containing T-cell activation inhibitor 1-like [Mastacembelus armatus]